MHVLERRQVIPVSREEAFAFFEDPGNLARITPPEMGFRILKVDDPPMRRGFRIKYRIRVFGIPVTWVTLISEYEHGRRFVDDQLRGPYAFWRHEHTFEEADGGTLIGDRVQYELPFGILGDAVHGLVARKLREIFDYRARVIAETFTAAATAA